jgi:putative FmdB family regulatory protein
MPTYEYYCKECKFEFEEFQSIASEPLQKCPKCNGKVERKISGGTGLIFKGSGFYITDYKNKKTNTSKPTGKPNPKDKPKKKVS